MMQKYMSIGAVAVIAAAVGAVSTAQLDSPQQNAITENVETAEGVNVRVYKNGELVTETHNALMEGRQAIQWAIGNESYPNLNYTEITVGNGTAPSTGDTTLDKEIDNCGLAPKQGTYDDLAQEGAWNLSVTFDVTCDDVTVNTTAQHSPNAPSDYDYFAGADLNRNIDLFAGDSLTIEWKNEITE
jgi:hypothetical protein